MLNSIKSFVKKTLNNFGYELQKSKLLTASDDPFFVLSKILCPDKVKNIIDAGASIGETSYRLSKFFPKANIYAIEPFPPFFKTLSCLSKDNYNLYAHNIALSNFNGKSKLNINKSEGTNSLLDSNFEYSEVFDNLLKKEDQIEVKCTTLDSFTEENKIEYLDIIKLDLQGYESKALEGASNFLQSHKVGVILCEIIFEDIYKGQSNPFELINYLVEKYSFKFFNIYQNIYHKGKLIQADAILIHKSKFDETWTNCEKEFHAHSKFLL